MKKEKIIKVRLTDYPLVKRRKPTFDEIGEYVHDILVKNVAFYGKHEKQTRKDVRIIVEYQYGKKVADKYTDKELEDAWFQYEPQ